MFDINNPDFVDFSGLKITKEEVKACMDSVAKICITDIDENLLANLNGKTEGWKLYRANDPDESKPSRRDYFQIIYNDKEKRAGVLYVGNGSNGYPDWTDCGSSQEAVARVLTGTIIN